jgi:hypothetical protein
MAVANAIALDSIILILLIEFLYFDSKVFSLFIKEFFQSLIETKLRSPPFSPPRSPRLARGVHRGSVRLVMGEEVGDGSHGQAVGSGAYFHPSPIPAQSPPFETVIVSALSSLDEGLVRNSLAGGESGGRVAEDWDLSPSLVTRRVSVKILVPMDSGYE